MTQTAVEWFIKNLNHLEMQKSLYKLIDFRIKKQRIIDQAKEMEEQQKQNYLTEYFAWHKSMGFVSHTPEDVVEFNQTYGGNK